MENTQSSTENISPELPEEVVIEQELLAKVGAVRAIATAHNLIDSGSYKLSQSEAARLSLEFLRSLHEQALTDAQAHPQAYLIPELNTKKED